MVCDSVGSSWTPVDPPSGTLLRLAWGAKVLVDEWIANHRSPPRLQVTRNVAGKFVAAQYQILHCHLSLSGIRIRMCGHCL